MGRTIHDMKNKTNSVIKQTELVVKRQEQIFNAASKLFVQKGFQKTTIRDIARESGLGIGPIYDYVKNKEEILFMVHKRVLDQIYEGLKNCMTGVAEPKEKLEKMVEFLFIWTNKYQSLILFIYQESHMLSKVMQKKILRAEKNTISLFEQVLKEGRKKKIFGKINSKVGANMIILLIHGWVLKGWDLKDIKKELRLKYTIEFIFKSVSI